MCTLYTVQGFIKKPYLTFLLSKVKYNDIGHVKKQFSSFSSLRSYIASICFLVQSLHANIDGETCGDRRVLPGPQGTILPL